MSTREHAQVSCSDQKVRESVTDFLESSHFPAFRNFDVDVDQGLVTITGQVSSFYEKQVAITCCHHVDGVLSLIDKIEVSDRRMEREKMSPRIVFYRE